MRFQSIVGVVAALATVLLTTTAAAQQTGYACAGKWHICDQRQQGCGTTPISGFVILDWRSRLIWFGLASDGQLHYFKREGIPFANSQVEQDILVFELEARSQKYRVRVRPYPSTPQIRATYNEGAKASRAGTAIVPCQEESFIMDAYQIKNGLLDRRPR